VNFRHSAEKTELFSAETETLLKVIDQYSAENETCRNSSNCCFRRRNRNRISVGLYVGVQTDGQKDASGLAVGQIKSLVFTCNKFQTPWLWERFPYDMDLVIKLTAWLNFILRMLQTLLLCDMLHNNQKLCHTSTATRKKFKIMPQ